MRVRVFFCNLCQYVFGVSARDVNARDAFESAEKRVGIHFAKQHFVVFPEQKIYSAVIESYRFGGAQGVFRHFFGHVKGLASAARAYI